MKSAVRVTDVEPKGKDGMNPVRWIEGRGEFAVIALEHEYGSANSRKLVELEQRLLQEVSNGSPRGLLIDFGQTVYIGCGLLNVLLRCHARAKKLNRQMAFSGLSGLPNRVFAATRLHTLGRSRRALNVSPLSATVIRATDFSHRRDSM